MTPFPPLNLVERLSILYRRAVHSPRNPDVRDVVRLRAGDACEYCLLPTIGHFNIEHIIPPSSLEGLPDRAFAKCVAALGAAWSKPCRQLRMVLHFLQWSQGKARVVW